MQAVAETIATGGLRAGDHQRSGLDCGLLPGGLHGDGQVGVGQTRSTAGRKPRARSRERLRPPKTCLEQRAAYSSTTGAVERRNAEGDGGHACPCRCGHANPASSTAGVSDADSHHAIEIIRSHRQRDHGGNRWIGKPLQGNVSPARGCFPAGSKHMDDLTGG